jgi:hypothetical protein
LNSKRASEAVSSENLAQSMTICSSTRSSSAECLWQAYETGREDYEHIFGNPGTRADPSP